MGLRRALVLATISAAMVLPGCGGDDGNSGGNGGSSAGGMGGSSAGGSAGSSVGGGGTGGTTGGSAGTTGGTSAGGTATGGSSTGGTGGSNLGPFSSKASSTYEQQTSLAADGSGGLVAVWLAYFADDTSAIGYSVSRDNGASWTAPKTIGSPGGLLASNPVVAVDSNGRFALSWLGFTLSQTDPNEHVFFSTLDSTTETFGDAKYASDDGTKTTLDFDKPSLTADGNGDFLLTWAALGGSPAIGFARTTDGTSFSRTTLANDATFGNLAYLCLDRSQSNAPLYIVHLSTGATLTVHRSLNGGTTWAPLTVPATDVLFQDPTCAASGNDLWISYATGVGFDPQFDTPAETISVIHSANQGDTMGQPVVASDGGGDKYLFPRLLRTSDGKLAIVHYQGQVGAGVELKLTSSSDGTSWSTSSIASAGTMTTDKTLANWLGAYVGFVEGSANLHVTYTENSENVDHIAFATVAKP